MKKLIRTFNGQRYVLVSPPDFYRLLDIAAKNCDAHKELRPFVEYLESDKVDILATACPPEMNVFDGSNRTVVVAASDLVQ